MTEPTALKTAMARADAALSPENMDKRVDEYLANAVHNPAAHLAVTITAHKRHIEVAAGQLQRIEAEAKLRIGDLADGLKSRQAVREKQIGHIRADMERDREHVEAEIAAIKAEAAADTAAIRDGIARAKAYVAEPKETK